MLISFNALMVYNMVIAFFDYLYGGVLISFNAFISSFSDYLYGGRVDFIQCVYFDTAF